MPCGNLVEGPSTGPRQNGFWFQPVGLGLAYEERQGADAQAMDPKVPTGSLRGTAPAVGRDFFYGREKAPAPCCQAVWSSSMFRASCRNQEAMSGGERPPSSRAGENIPSATCTPSCR